MNVHGHVKRGIDIEAQDGEIKGGEDQVASLPRSGIFLINRDHGAYALWMPGTRSKTIQDQSSSRLGTAGAPAGRMRP